MDLVVIIDGKEVTMQVKVGDKVIYSKYAGTDVELEGEKYIIVKQSDILQSLRHNIEDKKKVSVKMRSNLK